MSPWCRDLEAEAREELSLSLGSASFHERAQCAAFGLWPFGAAVSVALVAIMFVTIYFYMRFVLSKTDTRRAALV